jgi:hypothetical protein
VSVLEVMAIFVGGGEGLAARCVGAVDQGKGGFAFLEEDEDAGELGGGGDGQPEDAAAVDLGEGEDVADGLIPEPQAAAFLLGQALGGDVGVEGSEREAASRPSPSAWVPLMASPRRRMLKAPSFSWRK